MKAFVLIVAISFGFMGCTGSGGSANSDGDTATLRDENVDPAAKKIVADSEKVASDHAEHLFTIYLNHLVYGLVDMNLSFEEKTAQLLGRQKAPANETAQEIRKFSIESAETIPSDLTSFLEHLLEQIVDLSSQQRINRALYLELEDQRSQLRSDLQYNLASVIGKCEEGHASNIDGSISLIPRLPFNAILAFSALNLEPLDILFFSGSNKLLPSTSEETAKFLLAQERQGFHSLSRLSSKEQDNKILSQVPTDKKTASITYVFNNKANSTNVKTEFTKQCADLKIISKNLVQLLSDRADVLSAYQLPESADELNVGRRALYSNATKLKADLAEVSHQLNITTPNSQYYEAVFGLDSFNNLRNFYQTQSRAQAYDLVVFLVAEAQKKSNLPSQELSINDDDTKNLSDRASRLTTLVRNINKAKKANPVKFEDAGNKNVLKFAQQFKSILERYVVAQLLNESEGIDELKAKLNALKTELQAQGASNQAELLLSYINAVSI